MALTLKDFAVGQTVYVKSGDKRITWLTETTVKKVGVKHLTVGRNEKENVRYELNPYHPFCLMEVDAIGAISSLYATKHDYEADKELTELRGWARWEFAEQAERLPLDELRNVRKLVELYLKEQEEDKNG